MGNSLHYRPIAAGRCIVVLDTSPARSLAQETEVPNWVTTFSEMKSDGYMFSLAECACGELINQRSRGSITDGNFGRMLDRLEKFLDPTYPIMLGEMDVHKMIRGLPDPIDYERQVEQICRRAWSMLRCQPVHGNNLSATTLEEERNSWKKLFDKVNTIYVEAGLPKDLHELDHPILNAVFSSMDTHDDSSIVWSKRFDLRTRYFWRQFVRSKNGREPYNIEAPKKANDGIDFTMYTFLALPAFVVATDRGFFASIQNIPLFQKSWFMTPDTLAERWKTGSHPKPDWP